MSFHVQKTRLCRSAVLRYELLSFGRGKRCRGVESLPRSSHGFLSSYLSLRWTRLWKKPAANRTISIQKWTAHWPLCVTKSPRQLLEKWFPGPFFRPKKDNLETHKFFPVLVLFCQPRSEKCQQLPEERSCCEVQKFENDPTRQHQETRQKAFYVQTFLQHLCDEKLLRTTHMYAQSTRTENIKVRRSFAKRRVRHIPLCWVVFGSKQEQQQSTQFSLVFVQTHDQLKLSRFSLFVSTGKRSDVFLATTGSCSNFLLGTDSEKPGVSLFTLEPEISEPSWVCLAWARNI